MERSFEIDEHLLATLDDYHRKSMAMEKHAIEKNPLPGGLSLEELVDDPLIYHVPIYDMGSRKYAAFCSLTEAIELKEQDPKGNGEYFAHVELEEFDELMLFYLLRLCGSGINYRPIPAPGMPKYKNTHGFGNFWVVDSLIEGRFKWQEWLEDLKQRGQPFCDTKGYMLPNIKGGLKKFIFEEAFDLVEYIYDELLSARRELYQVTDLMNQHLTELGFKKQNFVCTAFAADVAEYKPHLVDPKSRCYVGTNGQICIKELFPKINRKVKDFDYMNEVLQFQSDRYGLNPIDCEDSRNCDVVRYLQEYQSKHHVEANAGVRYKNNSYLKKAIGEEAYYAWAKNLK